MSIFYKDQRLTHMSTGDSYTWQKFMEKNSSKYHNYRYDVRVGSKVNLGPTAPAWLRKSAESLSQKRIDVVMDGVKATYVVEVKVHAKSSVIGDLICYKQMYVIRYNPVRPVLPYLVTSTLSADLLIALKELKILFTVV